LPTNSTKVIINAKGNLLGENKRLQNVVKLMLGKKVTGDKHCAYAQKRIIEINNNEELRQQIMDYETKLLEREQDTRRETRHEDALLVAKKEARIVLDYGGTYEEALSRVQQDYGNELSEAELRKVLQEL